MHAFSVIWGKGWSHKRACSPGLGPAVCLAWDTACLSVWSPPLGLVFVRIPTSDRCATAFVRRKHAFSLPSALISGSWGLPHFSQPSPTSSWEWSTEEPFSLFLFIFYIFSIYSLYSLYILFIKLFSEFKNVWQATKRNNIMNTHVPTCQLLTICFKLYALE